MQADRPEPTARRTDLDLLRAILCGMVILSHALLIFAAEPRYHVKATETWQTGSALYEALRVVMTPSFFVIAGWSAISMLRRRSARAFLRDRVNRILIPLAAGIILMGPAIKYIELLGGRSLRINGFVYLKPIETSFIDFLPLYFGRVQLVTWSHLWFLAYLFLLCIVLLPALQFLARRPPSRWRPGATSIWLPAIVFAAIIVGMRGYWPYLPNLLTDWWNFVLCGFCMLIGGAMAAFPGIEAGLRQQAWALLAFGLICVGVTVYVGESLQGRLAVGLAYWGMIGGTLGLAMRYPPQPSRTITWLAEASMPIYVIHHLPLLLIGRWALDWNIPVAAKMVVIFAASVGVSAALYQFLVRPFAIPRLLTGLRAR